MISRLIQSASIDMKMDMETLLNGGEITVCFDEQIVFSQLENDENAVWSLMVASGYLKVCEVEYRGMMGKPWYHLAVTNMEHSACLQVCLQDGLLTKALIITALSKHLSVGM